MKLGIGRGLLKHNEDGVTSLLVSDDLDHPLLIMIHRNDGTIFMKHAAESGFEETANMLGIRLNAKYDRSYLEGR